MRSTRFSNRQFITSSQFDHVIKYRFIIEVENKNNYQQVIHVFASLRTTKIINAFVQDFINASISAKENSNI